MTFIFFVLQIWHSFFFCTMKNILLNTFVLCCWIQSRHKKTPVSSTTEPNIYEEMEMRERHPGLEVPSWYFYSTVCWLNVTGTQFAVNIWLWIELGDTILIMVHSYQHAQVGSQDYYYFFYLHHPCSTQLGKFQHPELHGGNCILIWSGRRKSGWMWTPWCLLNTNTTTGDN